MRPERITMLQPQIVEKPSLTFVGLEASFIHALSPDATNFKVISPLWHEFSRRAHEVPDRTGDAMYGVIFSRPEGQREHRHELQYLAGVTVSRVAELPAGMTSRTVPAGTFAVFIHRGPIKTIGQTMHEIYRVWLPMSGYDCLSTADIEVYDHRFCADGEASEMEYWVSVIAK
jgi:AraC family transcriptional regulator